MCCLHAKHLLTRIFQAICFGVVLTAAKMHGAKLRSPGDWFAADCIVSQAVRSLWVMSDPRG